MQGKPEDDFQDSKKQNFYFEGNACNRFLQRARLLIAYCQMKGEKLLKRIKNKMWWPA